MTRQQALENDIAYWLEDQGFDTVIDTLLDVCAWWADEPEGDALPSHTTAADWQKRVEVLRHLQWMLREP